MQPTHPSSRDEAPADLSPHGIEEEEVHVAYKEHNPRPEGRNLYLVSRGYLPYTHILLTVFQRELREFLIAEKVWLPVLKKKGPPPACATQQEVANFCDDQSCRPHQDRIVMAWFEPLSSKWNQECIALLAQKAQSTLRASITAGKTPQFNKEWLLIDALCSQIDLAEIYKRQYRTSH